MDRRSFLGTLAGGLLAAPLAAEAQGKPEIPRIGLLSPTTPAVGGQFVAAFRKGLSEVALIEGKTCVLEVRYGQSRPERFSDLARELVNLRVSVIVASTDLVIAAVRRQTQTIPIVMAFSSDPVGTGFVASFARPGGNVTGLSGVSSDLGGKRLELLKELVPGLSRIAILWNPDARGAVLDYKETEAAATSLAVQLQSIEVSSEAELDRAFSGVPSRHAQAIILPGGNPVVFSKRKEIARFAQKHRLPSMFAVREYVDAGGLMSYGPSIADMYRRAAIYVDRILKGAKPGDLPVERPTKFELVINLRTAKALGLTIPPSILARVDQVIE
ncbi:MAG TPA: ABC transporter substrate-binding protein [Methylomirabilota bacterium]|nr:ABC transporter substrate-binding protein [Methylomirabilota bacterium]